MTKKKKILISMSIIAILLIGAGIFTTLANKKKHEQNNVDQNKIEFFTIKDVEQVFINGVVTSVESKEFVKDPSLGKLGELKVKNGDNVEEGTVLYQYVDDATEKQITDLSYQIESTQAEKNKAAKQMDLEIKELSKAKADDTPSTGETSREAIELKHDLNSYDIKMNQLQAQINDLTEKKVTQVLAPFNGQVIIPQDQNRDSAIMTLTSNDFYVEGQVTEKDLDKIKVKQAADIRAVATNDLYKGEISYVSNTPITVQGQNEGGGSSNGKNSTLSHYVVKLTLNDAKNIRPGFHVQSSIKLKEQIIEIPKEAVKTDNETHKKYVLVDDFGTVLKKEIETKDKGDKDTQIIVTNGLESMDKVIISSDKELKDGDILPNQSDAPTTSEELI